MPSTRFRVAGASINQTEIDRGTSNLLAGARTFAQGRQAKRRQGVLNRQSAAATSVWADQYGAAIGGPEAPEFEAKMRRFFDLSPDMQEQLAKEETEFKVETDKLDRQERQLTEMAASKDPSVQEDLVRIQAAQEAGTDVDRIIGEAKGRHQNWKNRQTKGMMELGVFQQWMEREIAEGRPFNPEMVDKVEEYKDHLEWDANHGGTPMSEKQHRDYVMAIRYAKNDKEVQDWSESKVTKELLEDLRQELGGIMNAEYGARPYAEVQAEREASEFGGAPAPKNGRPAEPVVKPTPSAVAPQKQATSSGARKSINRTADAARNEDGSVSWKEYGYRDEGFKAESFGGSAQASMRGKASKKAARKKLKDHLVGIGNAAGGFDTPMGRLAVLKELIDVGFALGSSDMEGVRKYIASAADPEEKKARAASKVKKKDG